MKLIIVLLLAPVSLGIKHEGCSVDCPTDGSMDEKRCAYDKVCGFEAENQCQLSAEICLRELNGRPRFIQAISGYCVDTNKEPCKRMVDKIFA